MERVGTWGRVSLESMSDDRVLERVEVLTARSNELTAEMLAYLAEIDRRGLYQREATGSLFAFCVERLHMSEAAAGKRITAARLARRFPRILAMVARGEIHLAGLNLLAPHMTAENHEQLLARARYRTKREIEKLVVAIAPRPDVPSRVSELQPAPGLDSPAPASPVGTGRVGAVSVDGEPGERAPGRATAIVGAPAMAVRGKQRRSVVAPLSPRRYEIRVTVGEEAHAALVQLQDLMSHQLPDRDPAVIISHALELLLARTLARKAKLTTRPRAVPPPTKRTRHIPAAVERAVWTRDGGQCAFVDAKGRRCSSTRFLEYHHVNNWARGAAHEVSEIELRCRAHNQYQAVLDYGAELIAARRRSRSRQAGAPPDSPAREPRPSYRCGTAGPVLDLSDARDGPATIDEEPDAAPEREAPRRFRRGVAVQTRRGGTVATKAFSSTWAGVFIPTSAVPMPGAERAYWSARCALVRSGPSPRSPGPRGRWAASLPCSMEADAMM